MRAPRAAAKLPPKRKTVKAPARAPAIRRSVRAKVPAASVDASPVVTRPPAPVAVSAPGPGPVLGTTEERFTIPSGYGDHRIVLMVKDPWWVYAYWEIQPQQERRVRSQLAPDEMEGVQSILRVYDVTERDFPNQPARSHADIPLAHLANNWFIHTDAPNRSFIVDIGLLTRTGRFFLLARSNRVTTPRAGPSEVIDEQWMITDEEYRRLFSLTAGVGMGASESAVRTLLQRWLYSRAATAQSHYAA